MSGGSGDDPSPTALDLLLRPLTKDEQIAVLRFAQDRRYDADNEVFFVIALLKAIDGTAKGAVDIYRMISAARQSMEDMVIGMEERTAQLVEAEVDAFYAKFDAAKAEMASHAGRLDSVCAQMKGLQDSLKVVTTDASRVLNAYEAVKGNRPTVPLARILLDQMRLDNDRYAGELRAEARKVLGDAVTTLGYRVLAVIAGSTALICLLVILIQG